MKNEKSNNHDRGSLSVISDALPKLKGSAQKVAQFILNSPQETINLTITELGSRAGVSEASIFVLPGHWVIWLSLAQDSPGRRYCLAYVDRP
jgi:hypothetical protein